MSFIREKVLILCIGCNSVNCVQRELGQHYQTVIHSAVFNIKSQGHPKSLHVHCTVYLREVKIIHSIIFRCFITISVYAKVIV